MSKFFFNRFFIQFFFPLKTEIRLVVEKKNFTEIGINKDMDTLIVCINLASYLYIFFFCTFFFYSSFFAFFFFGDWDEEFWRSGELKREGKHCRIIFSNSDTSTVTVFNGGTKDSRRSKTVSSKPAIINCLLDRNCFLQITASKLNTRFFFFQKFDFIDTQTTNINFCSFTVGSKNIYKKREKATENTKD